MIVTGLKFDLDTRPLWYSIDPGKTCGVVEWRGGSPVRYVACTPDALFYELGTHSDVVRLVVEEFRLYPGRQALNQTMSTMETCEVIGVLKYLGKLHGIPVVMQKAQNMKQGREYAASIGVPMRDRKKNGKPILCFAEPKGPQHPRDALAHGYYYISKHREDFK